jgi:uncharacterized membrane protein
MALLALAGFAFLALHTVPATPLRPRLVAAIGEKAYLGVYTLLALILIVLWTRAFAAVPPEPGIWFYPDWWPWLKAAILLFASFVFVAGVSTPDPLAVAPGQPLPERPGTPKGIHTITRHPFLWSAGLWAVLHLISQPNLRGAFFFGLFAVLAFGGTMLIDMRKAAQFGEAWKPFAAQTSNLPFLAIAQGRATLKWTDIGWVRAAVAVAMWAGILAVHTWLFSASPIPGVL